MTKRIKVSVIRETAKALLIEAGGRQGWIQRRWMAADGTVAAATFEKAVAGAEVRREEFAAQRQAAAAEREFRAADHPVRVVRETEKAVAAEVMLQVPGGFEEPALVWFPKSAIGGGDGVALVPGWMIRDREERAADSYSPRGRGYYERHRWCKGEHARLLRGVDVADETVGIA